MTAAPNVTEMLVPWFLFNPDAALVLSIVCLIIGMLAGIALIVWQAFRSRRETDRLTIISGTGLAVVLAVALVSAAVLALMYIRVSSVSRVELSGFVLERGIGEDGRGVIELDGHPFPYAIDGPMPEPEETIVMTCTSLEGVVLARAACTVTDRQSPSDPSESESTTS